MSEDLREFIEEQGLTGLDFPDTDIAFGADYV